MALLHNLGLAHGSGHSQFGSPLGFFRDLVHHWSHLDITQAGSLIAILSTAPTAFSLLHHLWQKTYTCIRQFFLASVTIPGGDPLNRHVVKWLQEKHPRHHRSFTGRTQVGSSYNDRAAALKRTQHATQFLPHWHIRWFWHQNRLFLVTRSSNDFSSALSDPTYDGLGGEELMVSTLGWSIDPVRNLLQTCRSFADRQEQYFVIIYARDRFGMSWKPKTRKPIRRLDTVHFDGAAKQRLVEDVRNYLDVKTQQRYESRSMPYRRGYLFHGPPGTGKSSLSVAIAGEFGLDLYEVKIPNISCDADLEQMFQEVPPRCVILLEDIDAIWTDRERSQPKSSSQSDSSHQSCCTLSGILNVLDGVGTAEGRIVIMTTNRVEDLDPALTRPGRVDMQVYLGNISSQSAAEMFVRMFSSEAGCETTVPQDRIRELASQFAKHIPDNTITPSRLQGFFQLHLLSPDDAVANISSWLQQEGLKSSQGGFELVP